MAMIGEWRRSVEPGLVDEMANRAGPSAKSSNNGVKGAGTWRSAPKRNVIPDSDDEEDDNEEDSEASSGEDPPPKASQASSTADDTGDSSIQFVSESQPMRPALPSKAAAKSSNRRRDLTQSPSSSSQVSSSGDNSSSSSNAQDAHPKAQAYTRVKQTSRKEDVNNRPRPSGSASSAVNSSNGLSASTSASRHVYARVKQTSRAEDINKRSIPLQPPPPITADEELIDKSDISSPYYAANVRVKQTSRKEDVNRPRAVPANTPARSKPSKVIDLTTPDSSAHLSSASRSGPSSAARPPARANTNILPNFKRIPIASTSSHVSSKATGNPIQRKIDGYAFAAVRTNSQIGQKPQSSRTEIYDLSSASLDLPSLSMALAGPSVPSPRQQRHVYGNPGKPERKVLSARERITAEFNEEIKRKGIPIGKPVDPTRNMPGWPQPLADKTNGNIPDEIARLPEKMNEQDTKLAVRDMLQRTFEGDLEKIAQDKTPIEGLAVQPLPHQEIGIKWMLSRERNENKGGILADDMGLGKTLQATALMVNHRPDRDARRRTTLIVVPLSLLSQWPQELESKVRSGHRLRVGIYHGAGKNAVAKQFGSYDVVMTTYQTLLGHADLRSKKKDGNDGSEPARLGPLLLNKWYRVILDEAHGIKNRSTGSAKASFLVNATYRWCLTGTPIQNGIEDLYSLFHFLKFPEQVNEFSDFKSKLIMPMKRGQAQFAMTRLHIYLAPIMLRRTKETVIDGKPILNLPPKTIEVVKTDFYDEDEREFYRSIAEKMTKIVNKFVRAGTVMNNYTSMLVAILRMRQACNHPHLITKGTAQADKDAIVITQPRNLDVQDDDGLDDLTKAMKGATIDEASCAICQRSFAKVQQAPKSRFCLGCEDEMEYGKESEVSTKVRQLLGKLKEIKERDPEEKTIVFSQFVSMFELIKPYLTKAGFKFVQYDGSMNSAARETALEKLRSKKAYTVILLSFKCGSVGLNLTCCSVVFLLDLWWNPALESQAIDRAHRIGQKKPVEVYKFTIIDTIEDRILDLQEKKAQVAKAAIDGGDMKSLNRLTQQELVHLING